MKTVIRIGSRESRLAVTQTEIIKGQIEAHFPHIRVEIVTMKTTGDRILDRSLEQIGGKGLFVKELDQALRKGRVDLSVHSLKTCRWTSRKIFRFLHIANGKIREMC